MELLTGITPVGTGEYGGVWSGLQGAILQGPDTDGQMDRMSRISARMGRYTHLAISLSKNDLLSISNPKLSHSISMLLLYLSIAMA
jgi:hypothetical protein